MDADLSLIMPDYIREPLILVCIAIMIAVPAQRIYEFLKANKGR